MLRQTYLTAIYTSPGNWRSYTFKTVSPTISTIQVSVIMFKLCTISEILISHCLTNQRMQQITMTQCRVFGHETRMFSLFRRAGATENGISFWRCKIFSGGTGVHHTTLWAVAITPWADGRTMHLGMLLCSCQRHLLSGLVRKSIKAMIFQNNQVLHQEYWNKTFIEVVSTYFFIKILNFRI